MLMISGRREGARAILSVGRAFDELWIPLPSNDYRDAVVGFEAGMTLSPLSPSVGRRCVFAWTYPGEDGSSPGRIRGAPRARARRQRAPIQGLILNESRML